MTNNASDPHSLDSEPFKVRSVEVWGNIAWDGSTGGVRGINEHYIDEILDLIDQPCPLKLMAKDPKRVIS